MVAARHLLLSWLTAGSRPAGGHGRAGSVRAVNPDEPRGRWSTAELKELVLAAVAAKVPVDDVEAADIARFGADLATLADPFSREAGAAHITGSAFIVGTRGIVLHHHRRFGMWLQPGGHVDPGETPWDGARREAEEETGLAVQFLDGDGAEVPALAHVSVHDVPNGHVHYDLRYLFDGGDADPAPPPEESQEVRWLGWDDAVTIAEPDLRAILVHLQQRFDA